MLKEERKLRGITSAHMARLAHSKDQRIDWPLYSKIERGVVNPTPLVAKSLASELSCPVSALFDVGYETTRQKQKRATEPRNRVYKLTVRIPVELMSGTSLNEMIHTCGYGTINSWICNCYKKLQCEFAGRTKK